MSLPSPEYSIRSNGHSYEVWHSHFGLLIEDCETYGSAEDHAHEHAAERADIAQHELNEQRAAALADFIHALNRGDFDRGIHVGVGEDRVESSYITALRAVA